jgi:3-keto-disaccharide hydrolase
MLEAESECTKNAVQELSRTMVHKSLALRRTIALALATGVLLPISAHGQQAAPRESGWIQLFNGKDLTGWTPKIKGYDLGENFGDTFRVENGVLKVSYDQYQKFDRKFGHIFYKDKFSHYRLRVDYRLVGEQCPGGEGWATRNSGVMLHCQPPETMAKDQDFPASIEVQFLGGLGKGPRTTANLCTPGTHVVINGELIKRHCTNSTSKTYDGDQWVSVEVEVRGDKTIKHFVEGEEVLAYEQPQWDDSDPTGRPLIQNGQKLIHEGYISLQSESHPIEFRKVELKVLEK